VEWACENDSSVRYICAKTWPDQETVCCFRRANRPWVEAGLLWVYGQACPTEASTTDMPTFIRRKVEPAIVMDTATAEG